MKAKRVVSMLLAILMAASVLLAGGIVTAEESPLHGRKAQALELCGHYVCHRKRTYERHVCGQIRSR